VASQSPEVGFRGSLAATPFPQVLRRIFLKRLKGTLRVYRRDETRNLFFEDGELRTATSSREAQKIGAFLKRRGWITDRDLAWALETVARQGRARLGKVLVDRNIVSRAVLEAEMRRLVEEIVFSTFEWNEGEYRFEPSAGVVDPDVALDLSTAALIVEGIRRLPESDVFRERLGAGSRVPALSGNPMSRFQYLPLTPQEAYLLSRVDGVLDLDGLLKLGGASRGAAAKILYALFSSGIIEWKGEDAVLPPAAGLERLNVEVSAQAPVRALGHADLVRNTYRRIDWLTHYELLGVSTEATLEEIQKAYLDRSRNFHPDLRHRPDLQDCGKELSAVFDRLTSAYEILRDPASRAGYDESLTAPANLGVETISDPQARIEMAAQNYVRALQLIEEKEFHTAVEMLREAIHFVPDNAEYHFHLGLIEMQNAAWAERGLENLMEAARLEHKRQLYLREAARALHQHGRKEEALLFARRAVHLVPSPENQILLKLVLGETEKEIIASFESGPEAPVEAPVEAAVSVEKQGKPGDGAKSRPGFLSRLFRRRA
jgi:tetratricopeptide (TPR) repeat protein